MNVNKKTSTTYSLTHISEDEAQALLNIACRGCDKATPNADTIELETLNNMRQAFLAAGLSRTHPENAN